MTTGQTGTFLEKHLGTIISTVLAIAGAIVTGALSYVIGTTKAGITMEQMGHRLDSAESRLDAGEAFHRCATRHLDMLEHGIKAPPACDLGDKE